jgi:hypothetical protein
MLLILEKHRVQRALWCRMDLRPIPFLGGIGQLNKMLHELEVIER